MPDPMSREEARELVREAVLLALRMWDDQVVEVRAGIKPSPFKMREQLITERLEALPPEVLLAFCGAGDALDAARHLIDCYSCDLERDSADDDDVPSDTIEAEQRWDKALAAMRAAEEGSNE